MNKKSHIALNCNVKVDSFKKIRITFVSSFIYKLYYKIKMKSFKVLFMIMLSAAVLVGCSKKKPAADAGNDTDTTTTSVTTGIDFDALSKGMCDCATDMLGNMKKMQELTTAGDTEGLTALAAAMETDGQKFETCVAALEAKYPDVDGNPEYEDKAEAALKKNCPDLAKAMGSDE